MDLTPSIFPELTLGNTESGAVSPASVKNWTPKRRELLKWFQRNCAPLAEAYDGAVRLLSDERFPGRVHFIAHAVRDIADRLIFVLDPQIESTRVQYAGEMDTIEKLWPKLDPIDEAGKSSVHDVISIRRQLAMRIDALVQAHREFRRQPPQYELLFRYLMRHDPSQGQMNQRLASDFKKTREWFMERAHLRRNAAPQVTEADLQAQFGRFETMLHSFVGDFFTGIAELDEILQQANQ